MQNHLNRIRGWKKPLMVTLSSCPLVVSQIQLQSQILFLMIVSIIFFLASPEMEILVTSAFKLLQKENTVSCSTCFISLFMLIHPKRVLNETQHPDRKAMDSNTSLSNENCFVCIYHTLFLWYPVNYNTSTSYYSASLRPA